MVKLRKQRKRKKYMHNVNRKRLRNRIFKHNNITCKEVKLSWESKKSIQTNLAEMGLSYNPNETIKISNSKAEMKSVLATEGDWTKENIAISKAHVVQTLEREAKAPRERKIRLPKGQVERLSYLIEKYGNDYKAMERDKKNYNQETWKQLRQKIKRFMGIPEQFNKFLEKCKVQPKLDNELTDDEI
ncbi:nucleolar protein 16 [Diorhabda carinulata]|uniref:nucleolar protein 16 n=1 Tax=Diorhabda carinulata TaxID=1163345 RepID=UPI0025A18892|nr:nucleolar protein 16 [Diorhabda carinulata]